MATEKHLIYKEDLLDSVLDHFGCDLAYFGRDLQFCQEAINMAPAVDAVEVVRCKDCKNCRKCVYPFSNKTFNECKVWRSMTRDNDFCSYGERRERE